VREVSMKWSCHKLFAFQTIVNNMLWVQVALCTMYAL
jgi:hypothetical protein